MGSKGYVFAGGIVAVVAAGALLVPSLAFGQPIAAVLPGAVAVQDAGQGERSGPGNGHGNAWGHHKDSPDFPGKGKGLEKNRDKDDPAGKNGHGNKLGHDKGAGNPHTDDD